MNSNTDNSVKSYQMSLMRYAVEHVIEDVFAAKADGVMVYANGQIRQHYGLKDEEDMSCINIKALPQFPGTVVHWGYILSQVDRTAGKGNIFLVEPMSDCPEMICLSNSIRA
jgi:hypothetical protein